MRPSSTSRGETGQTLLILMVVTFLLLPLGAGFVRSMMLQQRLAGGQYRAAAALNLAEAGIEKTLWFATQEAPNGTRGFPWTTSDYTEEIPIGQSMGLIRASVQELEEGRVAISSMGELGGGSRGVKVIARVASPVAEYGLFGAGLVAILGDQTILSLIEIRDHCRPGIMLASNGEVWFRSPGSRLEFTPCGQNEAVLRLGLPDPRRLTVGDAHGTARYLGLPQFGIRTRPLEVQTIPIDAPPIIDAEALRRRAERNDANAALNQAAGQAAERPTLRNKQNSLYTAEEFDLILRHLRARESALIGAIYVSGNLLIPNSVPITIYDGFLAVEGNFTVEARARLTVRHSRDTRLLPAVVTIGKNGSLVVAEEARLELEGVVASEGPIDIREGARVQVTGAIMGLAPELSLRLNNATLRIRSDPMAPGTVGILAGGDRKMLFPLSWQELR